MRYGVYVYLSDGRMRPYLPDLRTHRRARREAASVNADATAARYGWRAFVLDRDNPPAQERP